MSIWSRLSPVSKFSILAFLASAVLSVFSMGALGYLIYYLVGWLLPENIESLSGDAIWPSVILAGMAWSVSFLVASLGFNYLKWPKVDSVLKFVAYVLILWVGDWIVWYLIIHFKIVQ